MACKALQWREPEVFASGDTLVFLRSLPEYLPTDGWKIHYELTQPNPNGAKKILDFYSTQSTTDSSVHSVNVPNFAAGVDAGDYILSAQVVNANGNPGLNIAAGMRQTIYYGELMIGDDLADGLATTPQQTFVQQLIPIVQAKLTRLEAYDLTETDVQRTRFVVEDKNKTWERYWRLLEFRNYELKQERAANTGQDQNYVRPVFAGGW